MQKLSKKGYYNAASNWDMTPEELVRLYLEWGNNWAKGDGYVMRPLK